MGKPRTIAKVLIIANLDKNDADDLVEEICRYLKLRKIEVNILRYRGKPNNLSVRDHDLAFSLGGDGTVLFCARLLADKDIPILPVNLGNFGFITEIAKDEWQESFEKYQSGALRIGNRVLLRVRVFREGREVFNETALNDLVISSAGISKLVNLSAGLSGLPIVRYRADGVIVATPTGSTAYSAAAGGPILHPEMDAMLLIPICPFTLAHRPLVIPMKEEISIEVDERQRTEIILTVDGQTVFPLQKKDIISATAAEKKIGIIQTDRRTFYSVLKDKLGWSGGTDA